MLARNPGCSSSVDITTLGRTEIRSTGGVVENLLNRSLALLVYLAVNAGVRSARSDLSRMLWPGVPDKKGRHSLSQAIYILREKVPEIAIVGDTNAIWIPDGSINVDLKQLQSAYSERRYGDCLTIYGGEFLPDLRHNVSPPFEYWRESVAEEARCLFISAGRAIIEQLELQGQWADLVNLTSHLIQHCPDIYDFHAARLRAVALTSNNPAVREAYRVSARRLRELGINPSPLRKHLTRLLSLHAQISQGAFRYGHDTQPIPLVGRDDQLRQLAALCDHVRTSELAHIAFVFGQAGIGKTAFCQHFLRVAAIRGWRILDGQFREPERSIAYGGLFDTLATHIKEADLASIEPVWVASILEVLPELSPPGYTLRPVPLSSEGAQRRLFESITRLILALAMRRPVVLHFDDVQWADEASVSFLQYLIRRSHNARLLVLLSARREELSRNRNAYNLAVEHTNHTTVLSLGSLPNDKVSLLVQHIETANGLRIDSNTRDAVIAGSGGVPFLAIEMLRALRTSSASPSTILHPGISSHGGPRAIHSFLTFRTRSTRILHE